MHLDEVSGKKRKHHKTGFGTFVYDDPAAGIHIDTSNITTLTIMSGHVHFTGTDKVGKHHKVSFTVDLFVTNTGSGDTFSITISDGYSASGPLTSGDVSIHN